MGYSVKWLHKNLGITRDMLRYYEKEKLLPANEDRKYRDYSDEDVERIWGIKLLMGIQFTAKEVYALMHDPDFDFDTAIAQKIAQLESQHDKNLAYLKFAKSIKFSGCIPTMPQIGSVKFKDFLAYVHKNWNFYDDPRTAPFMQVADTMISKEPQEWNFDEAMQLIEMLKSFDMKNMMHMSTIHVYCQVISDMRDLGYDNDAVQRVVRLLHEYLIGHNTDPELEGEITSQYIAKYMARLYLYGDISVMYENVYGKEGCQFIARAFAYYGGYEIEDL